MTENRAVDARGGGAGGCRRVAAEELEESWGEGQSFRLLVGWLVLFDCLFAVIMVELPNFIIVKPHRNVYQKG